MFFYKAYNLSIASELELSELEPIDPQNIYDVSICLKKIDSSQYIKERKFSIDFRVRLTDDGIFLISEGIDICKIIKGKTIFINPDTGLDHTYLKILILGPVLTLLLQQRNYLVLHASAIDINGHAVAFIGTNGTGKSTTLFALNKKGYPLITDDILCITSTNDIPLVNPSYPRLKLNEDVMIFMNENIYSTPKTHVYADKYSYLVNKYSSSQKPLKNIYVLETGTECKIETISSKESLMKLIESSYCFEMFSDKEIKDNFKDCAQILENVQVKRLKILRSFYKLPDLIKIIENDN